MTICSTTWWATPGNVFWSRSSSTAPGGQRAERGPPCAHPRGSAPRRTVGQRLAQLQQAAEGQRGHVRFPPAVRLLLHVLLKLDPARRLLPLQLLVLVQHQLVQLHEHLRRCGSVGAPQHDAGWTPPRDPPPGTTHLVGLPVRPARPRALLAVLLTDVHHLRLGALPHQVPPHAGHVLEAVTCGKGKRRAGGRGWWAQHRGMGRAVGRRARAPPARGRPLREASLQRTRCRRSPSRDCGALWGGAAACCSTRPAPRPHTRPRSPRAPLRAPRTPPPPGRGRCTHSSCSRGRPMPTSAPPIHPWALSGTAPAPRPSCCRCGAARAGCSCGARAAPCPRGARGSRHPRERRCPRLHGPPRRRGCNTQHSHPAQPVAQDPALRTAAGCGTASAHLAAGGAGAPWGSAVGPGGAGGAGGSSTRRSVTSSSCRKNCTERRGTARSGPAPRGPAPPLPAPPRRGRPAAPRPSAPSRCRTLPPHPPPPPRWEDSPRGRPLARASSCPFWGPLSCGARQAADARTGGGGCAARTAGGLRGGAGVGVAVPAPRPPPRAPYPTHTRSPPLRRCAPAPPRCAGARR